MRQESLGEGDALRHRAETCQWFPAGQQSCPATEGHPAGSESCVAMGQPILRSVDSECAGRAMEPRKDPTMWEPSSSRLAKAASRHRDARCLGPTGVREQGMSIWGNLRNLGGPTVSSLNAGEGLPDTIPWLTGHVLGARGETNAEHERSTAGRRQRRTAGSTVGRRSGSRVPRRVGNSSQRTHWREGSRRDHGIAGGTHG